MPRKSKKRSAEAVEDGENRSPENKRADIAEAIDEVKEPEEEEEDPDEMAEEENSDEGVGEPRSPVASECDDGDHIGGGGEDETPPENDEDVGQEEGVEARSSLPRRINVEGKAAEAGVIKSIYVENFMCHAKMTVELCRNVNFINGQNGSGKSAILAAIQICLGASARRTHRAKNIKGLVRKEATGNRVNNTAKVRVTLLNGGDDGYKPELYGERITVERIISLNAGGGYRLLDENDKLVSTNKKDLDDMLDHLNIQVENPVAILDQEEAKKFLTGKATDKYNFFMKATELERIDNTFAQTADRANELEVKEERLKDSLENKVSTVKRLKDKVEEFKALETLQKKRLDMEVDFAWAFFNEQDSIHQQAFQDMETFRQKVEQKQSDLSQAEEKASGANDVEVQRQTEEKMKELEQEATSQTQLKIALEKELKDLLGPIKKLDRNIKSKLREQDLAIKDLNRAKKRLKEAREENLAKAGSDESEAARRTALLNETEEALSQAKAESDGIKEAVSVAYQKYEEMEPEVEQAKQSAEKKDREVFAVKRKVRDLQASSANDPIAVFGNNCSRMFKMVADAKQKGRFRGEVIGPIGAFIKIAPGKEKYAGLAEIAIGQGTLDRFIVTNDHDRKIISGFRDQLRCTKECGLFQVHVSPRFKVPDPPAEDIETVASVLSITNDIVFNCLVDNARIDCRAFAPSKEVSEERLLITEANGKYKIRGIISEVAFLPDGDKWTVRDGNISMSSSDSRVRERKIGVDRSKAIQEAENELRHLEAEVKELRATEAIVGQRRKELQRDWNVKQRAKRENADKITKLTQKIEEIQNEIETTASASNSLDTTDLEEDIAQAEETLDKLKDECDLLKKELAEKQPGVQDARNRVEEVTIRNEKVLKDMQVHEDNLEKCLARLSQSESQLQKKREKLKKLEAIIGEHQAKVDCAADERSKALVMARKLTLHKNHKKEQDEAETDCNSQQVGCEFTEEELAEVEIRTVSKDSKSYEAKLKRLKDKIEKEREKKALSNEDYSVAVEKYHRANTDLRETQAAVEETRALLEGMEKDMRERRKRWNKLQKYLSDITDCRFDKMLNLNNGSGQLDFDHENNELQLIVQKDKNDSNSQTKDVKSLSGGERSYTTISLLLALGESLETPFRVLDEFDVFLDPQARKLTIKTLIYVAKKMQHRQFIFITPQDLSSVTPDDQLKVFKLKPPERNQLAGGLTQQTLDFSQAY